MSSIYVASLHMCRGTAIAIFVDSNLWWHIILKLTYILPSTTSFFLLLSLYSTCFSHADHPEAFKYITLKPKINVYISIYMQLVNAVMNLQIPLYAGNFLTSWEPVELLKKVSVQCSELVSNGFIFWLRGILSWLKFSL